MVLPCVFLLHYSTVYLQRLVAILHVYYHMKKGIVDEEDLIVTTDSWQAQSPALVLRAPGLPDLPGQRI